MRGDQTAQLVVTDRLPGGAGIAAEQRARRTSVDLDSSQITGRKIRAMRSSGGANSRAAPSLRCRASRFGASSPTTSVTNEMSRVTPMMPVAPARPSLQPLRISHRFGVVRQGHRAERAGQQGGGGHADLHGGQEPVRVRGQPRDRLPASAALGQRAHLALAQRDQRDLGGDEQRLPRRSAAARCRCRARYGPRRSVYEHQAAEP